MHSCSRDRNTIGSQQLSPSFDVRHTLIRNNSSFAIPIWYTHMVLLFTVNGYPALIKSKGPAQRCKWVADCCKAERECHITELLQRYGIE